VSLCCGSARGLSPPGDPGVLRFLLDYYSHEYFATLRPRLGFLLLDNYSLFQGVLGYAVAFAISALILAPVILKWRQALQCLVVHRGIALFGVFSIACCLLLPGRLPDQPVLYERFSVFFLIALILCGSLVWHAQPRIPLIVFSIVATLCTAS
jgi:hypothetical protein